MDELIEFIRARMFEIASELVVIRRELHLCPELAFQEQRTAGFVGERLRGIGLSVKEGIAQTGVVGLLEGEDSSKAVVLRADMDALPITEVDERPYRSQSQGIMHACGHDAHMACLIGAAMILWELRDRLPGSVKFVFQPSEEVTPGGAKPMIEAGVMENPRVEAAFALHVDPRIEVGKIGVGVGKMMAAIDTFEITILGKGGHAAAPHLAVDAIAVMAQVVQALQQVVSREVDPTEPVVISVGRVEGGYASNIIADRAKLWGTARVLNLDLAYQIPAMLEETIAGVTSAFGARYDFKYEKGYPPLYNHPQMVNLVRRSVTALLGEDKVVEMNRPSMGGEDFAYFLEKVPGCLFYLGVGNEDRGITHFWHHPEFDLDEDALPIGAGILAQVVVDYLRQ